MELNRFITAFEGALRRSHVHRLNGYGLGRGWRRSTLRSVAPCPQRCLHKQVLLALALVYRATWFVVVRLTRINLRLGHKDLISYVRRTELLYVEVIVACILTRYTGKVLL